MMHRTISMVSLSLTTAVALWGPLAPTRAAAILGSYNVVDIGPRTGSPAPDFPSIDNNGNITDFGSPQVGDYTLGAVFDPVQKNVILSNYLHRAGSDANLLPPALQDPHASILALNASGHVVGDILSPGGGDFYYAPETGQILHLAPLPGATQPFIELRAINDLDQIVGAQGDKAVFYSSPTAEPVELAKLLATDSGWTFLTATGINNRGEIVGLGINPDHEVTDYLLEPAAAVPEPTSALLFALGGLAVAIWSLAGRYRGVAPMAKNAD
jgi:hypothetical protein